MRQGTAVKLSHKTVRGSLGLAGAVPALAAVVPAASAGTTLTYLSQTGAAAQTIRTPRVPD